MLTFRQQEFARFYAQNMGAHKAAIAAGYATSTAETNAARLLRVPAVCDLIYAYRGRGSAISYQDTLLAAARLRLILETEQDNAIALQAIAQVHKMRQTQPIFIEQNFDKPDILPTSDSTQIPQGEEFAHHAFLAPDMCDIDHLPTGQPAFDQPLPTAKTNPILELIPPAPIEISLAKAAQIPTKAQTKSKSGSYQRYTTHHKKKR